MSAVIGTADQAALIAERLTSIAGPWKVGDIAHGTYESLWGVNQRPDRHWHRRSGGEDFESGVARPPVGTERLEQLYIDEVSGQLLDTITQGT